MRQDERHDLPGFPRIVRGTSRPHEVRRDASISSLWLGPLLIGAFRRLWRLLRAVPKSWPLWRKWALVFLWLVGLVCQVVLVWLAGALVDLCISLMEVWLELAEKHLEIVLSE